METLTLKLPKPVMLQLNRAVKKYNYGTKTEFVREAIRTRLYDLNEDHLKHTQITPTVLNQLKASLDDIKHGRVYRIK